MLRGRPAERWIPRPCDEALVAQLAQEGGFHQVIARVLANRGIRSVHEARSFLEASLDSLHCPSALPDMELAVDRLLRAVDQKEPILVYGDYDVDGLAATALLTDFLRRLGADVSQYIPHRIEEGYGLNLEALQEAADHGIKLVISVDCGSRAVDAISKASELGIETIITDHHEVGETLPPAVAHINPKRRDSTYPFRDLAGVGVAFKLAQAMVDVLGHSVSSFFRGYLDLVALGTVADVVPVMDENRVLVRYGLDCLRHTRKAGLRALIRVSGYENKPISPFGVAFGLAPRLNAVGRMDTAETALRLLLSQDRNESDELAQELDETNHERRREEQRITQEAVAMLERDYKPDEDRVVVLSSENWHPGVVGIVASRIKDRVHRPTIILCELDEVAKGSCRSVEGFDINAALDATSEHLTRHGGHAMAAGLELPRSLLERFREDINAHATRVMDPELLEPIRFVDQELNPEEADLELCNELAKLAPFGMGNPEPAFVCHRAKIESMKRVGDGSHLKVRLSGPNSTALVEGIAFGLGELADSLPLDEWVEIYFAVEANEWNGAVLPQLRIKGIRPSRAARRQPSSETDLRQPPEERERAATQTAPAGR